MCDFLNNDEKREIQKYLDTRKSTQISSVQNFIFDDNSSYFIGSAIKYNRNTHQLTSISFMKQKPIIVSINNESCHMNICQPKVILSHTLSDSRVKIMSALNDIRINSVKFNAYFYHFQSLTDLKVQTGISFQYGELFRFLASFGIENGSYSTNAMIIITSEYFSIDVDYINSRGAYNIIGDDVSLENIKYSIHEDDIPLFISSIKYGRQLFVSIQTNNSFDDLQAKLDINGPSILNVNLFFEKLISIEDIHARFFLKGFPENSITNICLSNISEYIRSMTIYTQCYSAIYCNLSNISDNSRFTLQNQD